MNTIFVNSEKVKHLILILTDYYLILQIKQTCITLSNLSVYYTWKNMKKIYKDNKFKISAPTWNEEFVLPDGSYSISDIQDYFKYMSKKHRENKINPSIRTYINKIGHRIPFKTKSFNF